VKFVLQGTLSVGSTLVAPYWEQWFGDSGGYGNQFQAGGGATADIQGPSVNGTIGTAITTAPSTAVTITPTFTQGSLANLPPGSAITIAGITSSTATASRTLSPNGDGLVVLSLANAIRIPPGELITVTGCSDATLNTANNVVSASDYSAKTITYYQTDATPTTGTGCTVAGFNDDAFESARILCSNGVAMPGYSATCSTGQITIPVNHNHSASDQWGEVAVSPALNTYNPQTWQNIEIYNCYGACFWGEGVTNLVMNRMGTSAGPYITSIAVELTGLYISQIHDSSFQAAAVGQTVPPCPNGGCSQPSYPAALRCDSDVPGLYYSAQVNGCAASDIDQGSFFVGGIKIDGQGTQAISGMPRLTSTTYEEAFGNLITIDNRNGIQALSCLTLKDQYGQDNVSGAYQYVVGYTDNEPPSGCVNIDNNNGFLNTITNKYFNGNLSVNSIAVGTPLASPPGQTASTGVYNEGNMIKAEIENEGASLGPQMLPFGSLPISTSPATWATLCVTPGCTVVTSGVVGPDGPNGQMQAAEIDGNSHGGNIGIATWTGATYPGDHFIYGVWVRPIPGAPSTEGYYGNNNSFNLTSAGSDTFAPTACGTGSCNAFQTFPTAFGTQLGNNGWYPQVAIATITAGESTPHTITFNLTAGAAGIPNTGNQFAQPFWTFIPGPNNPACTAAGTCNVTVNQIEAARQDQYHGFVPPGMSAGAAATGEIVSASGYKVNGVALNAPNETYNASASGSITLPSADRAEATYVLSGNVTASIGAGTGGGKVTIFVCQPASGGPYTWTWPASWKGGVTVGTTASTCSEQTGTYIAGLGDWHGDAGSTNVPQ
jgi:hypothetical protein